MPYSTLNWSEKPIPGSVRWRPVLAVARWRWARLDGRLELWSDSGQQRDVLKPQGSTVTAIAFTVDEQKLAAADASGAVSIWDLGRKTPLMSLYGQSGTVQSLVFSADGRKLAVGCGDKDPTPHVWDLSASPVSAVRVPVVRGKHLACPRNGRQLIVIDDFANLVRTWDWQQEATRRRTGNRLGIGRVSGLLVRRKDARLQSSSAWTRSLGRTNRKTSRNIARSHHSSDGSRVLSRWTDCGNGRPYPVRYDFGVWCLSRKLCYWRTWRIACHLCNSHGIV